MFYGKKQKKYSRQKKSSATIKKILLREAEMDFATEEAFNQLRTNITLSFSEKSKCRFIGITSSMKSEGKSFVSCCIANAIGKTGKKVLLVDGDMRLPTISKKLGIENKLGLSSLLTGNENFISNVVHENNLDGVDVITSGDIPPNPSELLGSERMKNLLEMLADRYDYVIIDLPPVTLVTDALVISKFIDGLILVVRHEHTDKQALSDTLRQIKLVNAKILGFVYNGKYASGGAYHGSYYKYKYRYSYYKGYYKYKKPKNAVSDSENDGAAETNAGIETKTEIKAETDTVTVADTAVSGNNGDGVNNDEQK